MSEQDFGLCACCDERAVVYSYGRGEHVCIEHSFPEDRVTLASNLHEAAQKEIARLREEKAELVEAMEGMIHWLGDSDVTVRYKIIATSKLAKAAINKAEEGKG